MKRRKDKTQWQVICESTNKMQKFLERKGIASSRIELERNTTIEIIGYGKDGRERLIIPELREKYGSDIIELDDDFQILMPFILKGTIILKSEKETHYEEYEVYDITDTKYSLKINDYIMYGKIFGLTMKIDIKSISRIIPINAFSYKCQNVMDFFINPYREQVDTYFSQYEKNAIIEPMMHECRQENVYIAIYNVIAIFRAMNYLKSLYEMSDSVYNIYSNEYFKINNWNGKMENSYVPLVKQNRTEEFIKELMNNTDYTAVIPKNQTSFIIKELIKRDNNVNTFLTAVGFVYESGLKLLEDELKMITKRFGWQIEMIIGSLQHFDSQNPGTKIDRTTVEKLNEFIEDLGIRVYTYQPAFYHGKFYYLCSKHKGYVIVGSSNISNTAYNSNYELDVIHTFETKLNNTYANWFFQLRNQSKEIKELDAKKYMSNHWESEQDAFAFVSKNSMSLDEVQIAINQLTDEEKKYRLNLWMEHRPTYSQKNVIVNALQDYIMFVFEYRHLVVFESFIPGNGYYIFRYDDLDIMLKKISKMSKSEMRLAEYSVQRGNHIQNRDNLKRKIDKWFTD